MAPVLLLLALGLSTGAALKVHEVPNPLPESYDDVLAKKVSKEGMEKLHIVPWDGSGKNVTIMGYPSAEDKEISGALAYSSNWEESHTRALCSPWSEQHRRGNFLDVGANIGTYSLPMAACTGHGNNGSVIAVEGMPTIADHLRAGIAENRAKNVALYNYAVGGKQGPNYVTMELDPINKGGSSVAGNKEGDASMLKEGVVEVKVPLTTLDAMLEHNPALTAVLSAKVDIEGNEGRFIDGAQKFFTEHTPCYLMMELIHEWLDKAGTPLQPILDQLTQWGYKHVPSYHYLTNCGWRSRTIHVEQEDMTKCTTRVETAYKKLRDDAKAALIASKLEIRDSLNKDTKK